MAIYPRNEDGSKTRRIIISEFTHRWMSVSWVGLTMLVGGGIALLQPLFYKTPFDQAIPATDAPKIL